jgi:uncharacterized protein YndB with AHSA1/START domain
MVYETSSRYSCDLRVFKTSSRYEADGNEGLWYFTNSRYDADKKIFITDSQYDADLIICYVDSKYDAGWQNESKQLLLALTMGGAMQQQEKMIYLTEIIPAPRSDVWKAWTTKEGITSFFAPECDIEIVPDGKFEIYFVPAAEYGSKGSEGCKVLAVDEERMLSFTWNAPPSFPDLRFQHTSVVVRFEDAPEKQTKITLIHTGWGVSGDWEKVYDYFEAAWAQYVIPFLKKRFTEGPINWGEL